MAELVTVTIDGRRVSVEAGTLLVEAAAQVGIQIPVYCYHPRLAPIGACRMCLVEVEGAPKLVASCTTPVKDGMVVHTDTPRVQKSRCGVLEFLLIHHPLDCPVCDKGGECPLQDFTYAFGPSASRFRYPKRHWEKPIELGPNILLDRERCIMCFRCVRFCEEVSDHRQIAPVQRGNSQEIAAAPGIPFDSQFSGNTIELCPVGALTGKPTRFFGRTWDISRTPGICTGCAAGCNIRVDTRHQSEVVRLWSRENPATDDGWLCDKGRFGFSFVNQDRLESPKLLSGGALTDASWDDALDRTAEVLRQAAAAGSLGIIASPRLTNEELWAVRTLAGDVLGTSNLDHTAAEVNSDLASPYGVVAECGFVEGLLIDLDTARRVILLGVDPTTEQPVTELRIKKALFKRGAELVTVTHEEIDLGQYATRKSLYSGSLAEAVRALVPEIAPLDGGGDVVVVGWPLTREPDAAALRDALAALAAALGKDTPCIVLAPHCNSRGALDLGLSPFSAPGGRAGLSGRQMLQAARDGRLDTLWILGEEPLLEAGPDLARDALAGVKHLIWQGWSLPEFPLSGQSSHPEPVEGSSASRLPDVVLAGVTFAEAEGTFTNTDGRVQRLFRAIRQRGSARAGWRIVAELSRRLGRPQAWESAQDVFAALASAIPAYGEVTWGRIGAVGTRSGQRLSGVER